MLLIGWIAVFAVSMFVLLKSSDFFVDSSVVIGGRIGIPQHIIGLTLVALGTSLPELAASIFAVLGDASEVVAGNVIGSNNANIFLVLGLTAVVARRIDINWGEIKGFIPWLVGSALFLAFCIYFGDGTFGWIKGLISVALLVGFIIYSFMVEGGDEEEEEDENAGSTGKQIAIFVLSGVAIYFSAKYLVDSIKAISDILQIGESIIAQTALALGTSLPELAVCLSAIKKGKQAIAVGNVVGSNIFNIFCIMGFPALIGPLAIPSDIAGYGLPMMLLATALFVFFSWDRKITFMEGCILVAFYFIFVVGFLF